MGASMADGQPSGARGDAEEARAAALAEIARQREEALRETEAQRLRLLGEIGSQRDSVVITYITSIREGAELSIDNKDVRLIEQHVRAAKTVGRRNVDLLIFTYGGHGAAPWELISMLREYYRDAKIGAIVPGDAYSAGACIALGADEIVMGPGSVLGPVDLQFRNAQSRYQSASDFQGFIDIVNDYGPRRGGNEMLLRWLISQHDGRDISLLYRRWKENWRIITSILSSRREKLSAEKIKSIAQFMINTVGSHRQGIRRTEARKEGKVSFITDLERTGLENEITELFTCYATMLRLEEPFARPLLAWQLVNDFAPALGEGPAGSEFDYDADGVHLSVTPSAIIESEHGTNAAYIVYGGQHWDKVPPAVPKRSPATSRQLMSAGEMWISTNRPRDLARSAKRGHLGMR